MILAKSQPFGDKYRNFGEDQIVKTLLLEGHAFAVDLDAARQEARDALARFSGEGLGYRVTKDGRLYDPVEVACFIRTAARYGDDYWEQNYVKTARRLVTDLKELAPAEANLIYRRHFDLAESPSGESRRLRMPLPLSGRYKAVDIEPEIPECAVGHRISDGRLEVRAETPGSGEVAIGARIKLDLSLSETDRPAQDDLYLCDKEGWIVITPVVAELADRLAGAGTGDRAALRSFWEYLNESFEVLAIHYDAVPPEAPLDWVLDRGIYDCQLAAALLCALCRARGIKARMIGGNFLYRRMPSNHFWAEIWIDGDGWVPVDFFGWDLSCGGRDSEWRDRFYGALEPRLITECLPRSFVGPIGVPIPEPWAIVRTIADQGMELRLAGVDGQTVYRDTISVPDESGQEFD